MDLMGMGGGVPELEGNAAEVRAPRAGRVASTAPGSGMHSLNSFQLSISRIFIILQ